MLKFLIGIMAGFFIGFGIRPLYNVITNKDIPLFKFPYIIYKNGSVEEYHPANQAVEVEADSKVTYHIEITCKECQRKSKMLAEIGST